MQQDIPFLSEESNQRRLDAFVSDRLADYSRATIAKFIKQGSITVNGTLSSPSYKLRSGDTVSINIAENVLESIDLPVVYEDDNVMVIDKPAGILTHSKGTFSHEGTVASFIEPKLSADLEGSNRGGIVHRLDRDTSGIMICAKNAATQSYLQKQFQDRKTKKLYTAVVEGIPKETEAILKWPIGRNPKKPQTFRVDINGKLAETHFTLLRSGAKRSLVELRPSTGRTHQLRVHMTYLGHPIVGDRLYGKVADRLYLHATSLEITIPGGHRRVFSSPVPKEFSECIEN